MSMFDRFVSSAKERVIDTVSATVRGTATAVGHISSLIGNPLSKDFDVKEHVASFGPNLGWKVYNAKKKTTGQEVSVLIFEKKLLDGMERRDREVVIEMMKKGVQQLTRLRHPRLMVVQHPVEESRDCLAFATEPIFASLANVLGRHTNMPSPLPRDIKGYEMYDVERVYGLFQLSEALIFLHNDAKILQGNLNPESIAITTNGQWKIGGMFFSSVPVVMDGQASYNTCQWEPKRLPWAMPSLNYAAPEAMLSRTCDVSSDMFSFGVLIYAVYNGGKPPYDCMDDITAFKRNVEQMTHRATTPLGSVPQALQEHVRNLMSLTPSLRMDAHQMSKIQFFDNVAAMTLQYLDSLFQRDEMAKSQFFKNLYKVISKLPKRVVQQRVLPPLCQEFTNPQMIPFVLPNVLVIAEDCTQDEYEKLILPQIKPVFKIQEPIQILLIFLQKMDLLLSKTHKESVTNDVLPMVFRALEAPSQQIQELVLNIIPNFANMIEYSAMKHSVIPRIKSLCLQTTSLSVRVHCLVCLGKILEHLDKYAVQDEILPLLPQIPSREAATLMAILGIYKQALLHKRLGLDKDYLAGKALPFLVPLAVEPALNLAQFKQYMIIIHDMIKRVETDHKTKLEQLNKMQEQTKSSLQFAQEVQEAKAMEHLLIKVDNLFAGGSSSRMSTGSSSSQSPPSRSKPASDNTTRSAEFNKMFGLSNGSESQSSTGRSTNSDLLSGKGLAEDGILKPSSSTKQELKQPAQKVPMSVMKSQTYSPASPMPMMSSGTSTFSMTHQQPRPSQPSMNSMNTPSLSSQTSAMSGGSMTWGLGSSNSVMSMNTGYNIASSNLNAGTSSVGAGMGYGKMGPSSMAKGTSDMGMNPSMTSTGFGMGLQASNPGSFGMTGSGSSGNVSGGGVRSTSGNKASDTGSFDSLMGMVPGMEHLQDRSKPSLNQMQGGQQAPAGGRGTLGMNQMVPQYGVSSGMNSGAAGMFGVQSHQQMAGALGMANNTRMAGSVSQQCQQQNTNLFSTADDLKSIFG